MRYSAASSERGTQGELAGGTVLHLVASGGLYGLERMLIGLLPALRQLGCDAALASLGARGTAAGKLGDALSSLGVPVSYPAIEGRFSLRGLARLEAAIRKCRPSIVHLHGYKAIILGGPISLFKRIPTVGTFHTEVMKAPGFTLHVRIEKHIIRRLHGMVAVSEPIRRELEDRGVEPAKIQVITNGIADPLSHAGRARGGMAGEANGQALRSEPAAPVLVFTGRLIEGKNVQLLIDAVHRLRDEFPGIRLLIGGEGPHRSRLEEQVGRLGLGDSVQFLGFVEDVYRLLAGSTCFVLPSRAEGMPIALLEAMAMSVPIVATTVGSIPSVVSDGAEAVLIEPDDGPALVAGLRFVLRDRGLRSRLGRQARQRFVREFTAERTAVRYLEFYSSLLGDRG